MPDCDPTMGGCWFCQTDDGEMFFSTEWDAFFHGPCLVNIIDGTQGEDWRDVEAESMAREYDLIDSEGKRIYTGPIDLGGWIGKKVRKTRAGGRQPKPFKSGFRVNTVKDLIYHPQLEGKLAFTFVEDGSYVACEACELYEREGAALPHA